MAEMRHPTQEWIDEWMDKYAEELEQQGHKVSDWAHVRAMALDAWWEQEGYAGRPTPYDLTPEQEKVSKQARAGMAKADKERKAVKRERKPNQDKRDLIEAIARNIDRACNVAHDDLVQDVVVSNPERQVDLVYRGVRYSIQLIAHRPPKQAE